MRHILATRNDNQTSTALHDVIPQRLLALRIQLPGSQIPEDHDAILAPLVDCRWKLSRRFPFSRTDRVWQKLQFIELHLFLPLEEIDQVLMFPACPIVGDQNSEYRFNDINSDRPGIIFRRVFIGDQGNLHFEFAATGFDRGDFKSKSQIFLIVC